VHCYQIHQQSHTARQVSHVSQRCCLNCRCLQYALSLAAFARRCARLPVNAALSELASASALPRADASAKLSRRGSMAAGGVRVPGALASGAGAVVDWLALVQVRAVM
jgi:hypothetical protein